MKTIQARKVTRPALCAALIASGLTTFGTAQAAASISGFELLSGGTLDMIAIDNANSTIDLSKTLTGADPLLLRITVAHAEGSGGPYSISESIRNMSGLDWDAYTISIDGSQGVVFNNFSAATLDGFILDTAPTSGPDRLSFAGGQAAGVSAEASFTLSFNDPGQGQTYTVDLVQTASPVPLPVAGYLLGSALVGLGVVGRRRRTA